MMVEKETILRVIRSAREAQAEPEGAHPGRPDDPPLGAVLDGLSHQELVELVALISVGRGDPGSERFEFILGNIYMTRERAIAYLLEKQHLAEYLEKAMRKLGMAV